jgi:SAM-dependent methyltransferase
MTESASNLYWLGNVAKTRIVLELLEQSFGTKRVTIFDYGCGDGGDWPRILRDHPHLHLVAFEPGADSYGKAVKRLAGCSAEILTGDAMSTLNIRADYIVSFSVFEHVVDSDLFLRNAKRVLAPWGCFYLNYDDGHFRNVMDLAEPATWLPALRARLRTLISPWLAGIGWEAGYQQRFSAAVADRLVFEHGFVIERVDYHNLLSLKELAKVIPDGQRELFSHWWLDVELALNRQFCHRLDGERFGDHVNLSRQMVSRTLCLRHPSA